MVAPAVGRVRPPGPRPRGAARALGALALTWGLVACGGQAVEQEAPTAERALGHVHGLGVNPADDLLYAASHYGVFRIEPDGATERVADRYQDTMGFTVAGPDRFLGSGHPDLSEDLPAHLGLIESTDAARTWSAVSLQGEADFHALDTAEGVLVGFDAASGRLLASADGIDWRTVAAADVVDLALDPTDPGRVLTTGSRGELLARPLGGSGAARVNGPALYFVDWPTAELLVGLGPGGVHMSADGGGSWGRVDAPPGDPQALDVLPGLWHVATSVGIFRSVDDGRSWQSLTAAGG